MKYFSNIFSFRRSAATASLLAVFALVASAAPIDDAKKLYFDEKYEEALPQLERLVKRSPRDGTANFYLGATLRALGRESDGVAPLKKAEERGVLDASRILAEMALAEYRVDDADSHLSAWSTAMKKKKKAMPEEYENMSSMLLRMRNMLDRVEKIEVIDSINVDADDFFRYYRLSKQAGRLVSAARLPGSGASVIYIPESNSEMLWAAPDSTGRYSLYESSVLDDGTVEHPAPADEALGEGGSANYPFLMSDGMTLYYANDGENSLGGYDIFMTSRSDGEGGGYLKPQNIGMPYNSPYNDYMLAIDEVTGLGWWASDRTRIPGKVTIYVFIPSQMRVNYPLSDEHLTELARLTSISLTWNPDADYSALRAKIFSADTAASSDMENAMPVFLMDMGNGKVYTSLSDFKREEGRRSMVEYLGERVRLRKLLESLDAMRVRYAAGETSLTAKILDMEAEERDIRGNLEVLRNAVVRNETVGR